MRVRVAIVHYWLVTMRGGERVVEAFTGLAETSNTLFTVAFVTYLVAMIAYSMFSSLVLLPRFVLPQARERLSVPRAVLLYC